MNSALWKDNLREIKKSLPRFLSIFAIIALGVSFFIGIRAAGPSMVETAREVYRDNNLPDGHVLSTVGLNDQDMEVLEEYSNLTWLPIQSVRAVISPGEENAKIFTYDGNEATNFFKIIEGRMVEEVDEIVLDSKYLESLNAQMETPIEIGDTITLDATSNSGFTLEQDSYEVVGFARTPLYIERMTRSGTENVFAILDERAVSGDIYSEAYYWVDEAKQYEAYSPEYNQVIEDAVASLETSLEDRPEVRVQELQDELAQAIIDGEKEIEDGYSELEDARVALKEAQKELSDGQIDVIKGQLTLDQAIEELKQGESDFKDGIIDYHRGRMELADARAQLNYNEQVYQEGLAQYEEGLKTFNSEIASAEGQLNDAQAQLDEAASQAQAGYAQLAAGQAELDAGYAQLAAGRQELLEQLSLATNGQIPPEVILSAIEGQIDTINQFLAALEAADSVNDPAILSWIQSLTLERDILSQNLTELMAIVAQLPSQEDNQQTLAELGLSSQELSSLSQLLNIELLPSTQVNEVIGLLNERIATLEEGQQEDVLKQTDLATYQTIQEKYAEIQALEAEIKQTETQREKLLIERDKLTNYEELLARRDKVSAQIEGMQVELSESQQNINYLEEQLQAEEVTEEEQAGLVAQLDAEYVRFNELTANNQALEEELSSLNASIAEIQSLDEQLAQLDEQLKQQEEARASLKAELAQLIEDAGLENLPNDTNLTELQAELQQLVEAVQMLQTAQATLDEQSGVLAAGWDEYYAGLAQLESAQNSINQGWSELNAQKAAGQEQLDAAYEQLTAGRQALDDGQEQLQAGLIELVNGKRMIDQSYITLQDGSRELATGRQEALEGRVALLDGQVQYQLNRHEFEEEEPDALADLQSGEADLEEAKRSMDDLAEPIYLVEDRGSSSAYQSLNNNAEQLGVISNIFPVFFFGIAILVTFTTIKRMASEQRNYMGTMKQLGYTNFSIIQKFVVYAGIASILGTITGLIIGYLVFPGVIINAYNMLFYFDNPKIEILWGWNIIAALIALATALIPAIVTPLNMLRTQPANLLQPEPPKAGRKLWLERFPAVWNRLSFNAKMTVRNLLRYKGRNSMTLIGVAGCTMLIVTGFGISNTISSIVDVQFGEIQQFDGMVFLEENLDEAELNSMTAELNDNQDIESIMPVLQETYDAELEDGTTQPVTVMVPLGDLNEFSEFVSIRERDQVADPHAIEAEGAYITERMGELLNLEDGESFKLTDEDYQAFNIDDYTVVENYVAHYLYVNPEQYESLFNKEPELNSYLVNYKNGVRQKKVEEKIMEHEDVLTTIDLNSMAQNVGDQMGSLDLITLVLIISAASLAFVVLYNLTNINVAERIRELSTIKVLGFYNFEVSMYIFNEVLVLTFLGGLLGLILGTVLNTYLLKTMQMVDVLFYPTISLNGYIASFVISFIFSAIVMIFMHLKLKKIDMVEALKGVD